MLNSCNLCTSLGGQPTDKKIFLDEDEKKAHAQLHFRQSKIIERDDESTIEQVIGQCFPKISVVQAENMEDGAKAEKKEADAKKSRLALSKHCHEVFANRPKSNPVSCQQCGDQLQLLRQNKKSWRMYRIIDHATGHLDNPMYLCHHCSYKSYTQNSIKKHLKNIHGAQSDDYDDLSATFEDKIQESIISCFQEGAPKLQTGNGKSRYRWQSGNKIRAQTPGSKLKIQRHLHTNRLLKQAASKDKKVICKICSKGFVKRTQPNIALRHVELHLEKQVYQCKLCPESFTVYYKIKHHAMSRHKSLIQGNYVDQSDQFHAEIMEMIDKCFG